ncbi:hypothetical protein [Streptomyces sp. NBC_00328]|uniref:hypothetical protein n=1 Tax=Streptomyces sp. NBC_00328 TaxID=2903646 RepID=UPI002E2C6033|nr:hypothetical protein [Streptomyces sp. NBC_00328]
MRIFVPSALSPVGMSRCFAEVTFSDPRLTDRQRAPGVGQMAHLVADVRVRSVPGGMAGPSSHAGVTIECRVILRVTGGMIFWLAFPVDVHGVCTGNRQKELPS